MKQKKQMGHRVCAGETRNAGRILSQILQGNLGVNETEKLI
jgi:hypothetical protein